MAGSYGDTFGGLPVMPGSTVNLDPYSAAWPAGSTGAAVGTGTGQHGVVPIASDLGGGVANAFREFKAWLDTPFTGGGLAPSSLFILVGVVLVSIIAWNFILYHVRIAAETI